MTWGFPEMGGEGGEVGWSCKICVGFGRWDERRRRGVGGKGVGALMF